MRKRIGLLLATMALAACSAPPPQTASRAPEGTAPGCYVAQNGQVVCPQQQASYAPPPLQQRMTRVQMMRSGTGGHYVDVGIDGICCAKMLLDTGASDVSVPLPLWYAMEKGGHIPNDNYIDVVRYRTANGVVKGLRFIMPPMQIGGVTVRGVVGSVSQGDTGSTILLGQSFLLKFKSWSIDNATGQLVLAY
jgi:clan AA aspartic protease (TIGR02281 family)